MNVSNTLDLNFKICRIADVMSFDITAPFQAGFSTRDQIEHRHKVHPVQIIAPLSSQPNRYKFLENSLISVLGHSSIANKKIFSFNLSNFTLNKCP